MSFATLLRTSNFAAIRPGHKQVFMAVSATARERGDFGLKHNLPRPLVNEKITVDAFDTEYGYCRASDGNVQSTMYHVFAENFAVPPVPHAEDTDALDSQSPAAADAETPNLSAMSDAEFDQIQELARKKRIDYQREVARQTLRRQDTTFAMEQLGVVSDPLMKNFPCSFAYASNHDGAKNASEQPLESAKVRGRVLNKVSGGFAIGLAGAVGFLPSMPPHYSGESHFNPDDRTKLYDFYLDQVKWDRSGSPHIVVSLLPLRSSNDLFASTDVNAANKTTATKSSEQTDLRSILDEILAQKPPSATKERIQKVSGNKKSRGNGARSQSDKKFQTDLTDLLNNFGKK